MYHQRYTRPLTRTATSPIRYTLRLGHTVLPALYANLVALRELGRDVRATNRDWDTTHWDDLTPASLQTYRTGPNPGEERKAA